MASIDSDLPALRSILAPTGTLRAAINFGNTVLAQRGPTPEAAGGVAVEIARELARRLDVPLQIFPFDTAGEIVKIAADEAFDITFMGRDPKRAADLAFSEPYVLIEGGYVVRDESPLRDAGEVDRPGRRITVGAGSAYDLYLSRTIEHAEIVREPTSVEAIELFLRGGFDAAAGVKASLIDYARAHPGLRPLDGRFMVIEQAMATTHHAAAGAIGDLIEELKASGFVAHHLAASGQTEATVAPPRAG